MKRQPHDPRGEAETPQEAATPLVCTVEGMDCPDCAAKLEHVVARLPGVGRVQVDFARQTLSARLASPEAAQGVRAAVHQLGYRVAEAGPVTTVLQVQGMDCAEERVLVERALGGLPGVRGVQINLVSQRLTVTHDPRRLPVERLIAALAEVGLRAAPLGATPEGEGLWARHGRTLSTAACALLTAVGLTLHLLGLEGRWEAAVYGAAIVSGGWFIARKGWAAARHLTLDMNFLMTVAVIGAVAIGAWDEAAMVVLLFALAQVLEGRAMDRARRAIRALMELAPPVARRLEGGEERTVPVEEVRVGDLFRLRPGERVPLDGEVVAGASSVDQAPITGESVPVEKEAGDTVYAGSINGDGSLDVRATHRAADTTLAHVIHLIEEAQSARAPSQSFVDRFAAIYTPAVLAGAALIALLPPLLLGQPFGDWGYRALVLLVIACPCALVISTPVAIVSGLARGARSGVLIKGGVHLERAGQLRALALDKTGTLTEGTPRVQQVVALGGANEAQVVELAAALEARSQHPLARAVVQRAREEGLSLPEVEGFTSLPGRGVEGRLGGRDCLLGNHRLFEERGLCTPEVDARLAELEEAGRTAVLVARGGRLIGLIALADTPRPEARGALEALRRLGVRHLAMVTGDNRGTAEAIGGAMGIDAIHAELLPADKVEVIRRLVREHGSAGMVGDGVNDAPALAAATTGIAMGAAGSDAALETADLVLMGDDLSRLPFAIRLSRATVRAIRQNILLALAIKALFLTLAVFGQATLWMAVLADDGATLLVIANSLRLLRLGEAGKGEPHA